MLKINKGKVPKEFYEAKRLYKNYDELDSTEKEKLKDILIPEQNNRCAYCTKRIDSNNSTIEYYIPRKGKDGDMSKSLDYNNLFAVCNSTRNLPLKQQTCDVKKGDKLLHIDPRLQNHIDTVRYDKKGIISSDNSEFDDDLNSVLNLNSPTLVSNRFSAFNALLINMDKKKGGSWTKEYIENILDKYKSNDNCTPYAGFIIYRLEQRLQKF